MYEFSENSLWKWTDFHDFYTGGQVRLEKSQFYVLL